MFNARVSRNSVPLKGALISQRISGGRADGYKAYGSAGYYVVQVLVPVMKSSDWSKQTAVHHMDVTLWLTTGTAIQVR
jgi:hypothetical protein